ncbi:MAG: tetratricopeptide repeat protein, partial [Bacteroidota bacterium]
RKGTYNHFVALSALVTIYLDAGDYARSAEAALEALKAYPFNRVFLWGLAEAQVKSRRPKEALETYERILGTCLDEKLEHPYSEMLSRLNIVRLGLELKDSAGVAGHLVRLLSYESYTFPEELRSRAQQKFDEARRIQGLLRNERKHGN